jgi:hypothetical protein
MALSNKAKQVESGNARTKGHVLNAAASAKQIAKTAGTRAGVLVDWRSSGLEKGKSEPVRRDRRRDGS